MVLLLITVSPYRNLQKDSAIPDSDEKDKQEKLLKANFTGNEFKNTFAY